LIAVLSCWLAWTILTAELPFEGAKGGVFPKFLAAENRFHAAVPSLLVSSVVMQITLFVVLFASNAWLWLIDICGVMILPPYFASSLFLTVYAAQSGYVATHSESRNTALITGVLATIYSAWLLYAAGPEFLLMSTIVFSIGIPVFWYARKEHNPGQVIFSTPEKIAVGLLGVAAIAAIVLFAKGIVSIS
jgi:arginine:ornithine antiporter/lysine permease